MTRWPWCPPSPMSAARCGRCTGCSVWRCSCLPCWPWSTPPSPLPGIRLSANRWRRGLRLLTPGIGIGLVLVFSASVARWWVPRTELMAAGRRHYRCGVLRARLLLPDPRARPRGRRHRARRGRRARRTRSMTTAPPRGASHLDADRPDQTPKSSKTADLRARSTTTSTTVAHRRHTGQPDLDDLQSRPGRRGGSLG